MRTFRLGLLAYGIMQQQGLQDTLNLYGGETCIPKGGQLSRSMRRTTEAEKQRGQRLAMASPLRALVTSPLGRKSSKTSPMGKRSQKDCCKALLEMDADCAQLCTAVERGKLEAKQERARLGTHLTQLAAIWLVLPKDRWNFEGFTDEILQPGIIVHYAALYDAPTWGVPNGPSTGMIVHVLCCFGPSRSRCVPGPRGLFFFESMFIALPFDPTQYEDRSPSPVRTPEPGPRGLPFDPTQYEDRSPSLVRTPEPLRVQKARKKQRLVARAAADAEREREWAEMYRMFAHDSVEQRRELEFISLIQ